MRRAAAARMGLEFLARVRKTSQLAGVVAALFAAVYSGYAIGLGVGAGVAWSLLNLLLLERIVTALTGEDRGTFAAFQRLGLAFVGSLALFAAGAFLLMKLPAGALAFGFTLPFAVMTLKAASSMLLASRAWKRFTANAWGPALLVAALLLGGWYAIDNASGALQANAQAAATEAPAEHATATEAPAAGEHAATPEAAAGEHVAGAEHAAAGEHAAEGEGEAGPKKFDTIFGIMAKATHGTPIGHFIHGYEPVLYSMLVALILCAIMIAAAGSKSRVPGGLANLVESLVEYLYDFVCGILGPKYGPKFVPFLGTLFLYIWFMNLFGIIPLMESPTSNLNVTFGLALTVVVFVQFTAIKELGLFGWVHHLAGSPRSPIEWMLVPLMLPIHVIGELAKPVSLSCRLFGNIFGEDMLLVGFASLGITMLSALHLPFGVPLHFIFLFLALMTSTIQALVFTMLSTVYFLLMLPHDDHGHEHGEEAHHPAH